MPSARLVVVLLILLAAAGSAVLLLWNPEPAGPIAPPAPPAAAPAAPATVAEAPRLAVVPEPPPPPVEPLVALPPDPIADRIAAGEELYTLHGEVLDAVSGKPVEMFRMWCEPVIQNIQAAAAHAYRGRTFANPLGTFTYRGLEPGTYNLLVRVDGYEELVVHEVAVPQPGEKMTVRLSRGSYIEVTVNDVEGDGVSDLEVRLHPIRLDDPNDRPRAQLAFTDDYGKALFTNVPPGVYRVAMENAALADHATQEFYLAPGAALPVAFTVPDLATVHVMAHTAAQEPLGLVQVRMWAKDGKGTFRAQTDSDGTAQIRHVPAGDYTVKLFKYGCRRKDQVLSVPPGETDVPLDVLLIVDPAAAEQELNPTAEQFERLKRGERPTEVFGRDG